jgi:hypothetical protein
MIQSSLGSNSSGFWDITLCTPLEANRHFRVTYHLYLQGRKMLIDFERTTRRYVREYINLHNYRCDNHGACTFGIIHINLYVLICDIYKRTSKTGISKFENQGRVIE